MNRDLNCRRHSGIFNDDGEIPDSRESVRTNYTYAAVFENVVPVYGFVGTCTRAYRERQRSWPAVERLPGYTSDFKPAECLWATFRGIELANRCDLEIADTVALPEQGMSRDRSNQQLPLRLP